ncbi:MAG: hypothetical protein O7J95_20600 [Planctomycetota bacterium]|nr:hypothetical protein [Planctomycetota bacterium]
MKKASFRSLPAPSFVFTAAQLKRLLEERDGPCVSVYFPAHRRKTEARSDSILYRNLCREVEKVLERDTPAATTRDIVGRLTALDDPEFWEHGSEGVAVFAATGFFACYRLPVAFRSLEVVGGTFHTKPLLRYLQEGRFYHVLAVSLHEVSLYEGVGNEHLHRVPLSGVPTSVNEVASGDAPGQRGSHPRGEDHHLQGRGGNDGKAAVERFFREVARGLLRNGLKDSRKPLILAAQSHHLALFQRVAQLPPLVEEGIAADPTRMTLDEIRAEAIRILRPAFQRHVERAKEEYGLAVSREQGSDRLQDVARATAEGRVRRLFVESGRRIWGLLDKTSGDVVPGEPHKNAHDVDLLDELAELTLARGGSVLVLSPEEMPSRSGLAAAYRF